MNNYTSQLWMSKLNRDDSGRFSQSDYGTKSLRSMRLSDDAWNLLEKMAIAQNKTRTDIIEEFARNQVNEQEIILAAIRRFIDRQRGDFGTNPAQKGKEFNMNSRNWEYLKKFMELVENEPWEVGIGE